MAPPTTFSDLIAEITEAAAYALLRAAGNIVSLDFEAMPQNSVVRTIVKSVVSPVLSDAFAVVTDMARGGFLDFAPDGPWLEALGEQMFDTTRIFQTFASCQCTFSNTSAEVYSFANRQVIVQNSVTRKTYYAPEFSLAEFGAPGASKSVTVTAVEPGSDSDAEIGDITIITTNYDGVTVTNTTAARGSDLEPKDAYIARCRLAADATSPAGPKQAYEYVCLSATDENGVPLGITKVSVDADDPEGDVTVYVATASGTVGGPALTRLNALVTGTEPPGVVPHGVDFNAVLSADPVAIDIDYTYTALESEGLSKSEIEDYVRRDLELLFASRTLNPIGGIGGRFYHSKIRSTIEQVRATSDAPEPIVDVTLNTPAGAWTDLDPDEIPVIGMVTPHGTLV